MFGVVQLKRRNRCYTDTLFDERIKSWFWPAQDLLGNEPLPRETSSLDMVLMYDMIKRTLEQNQSGLPHELLYFVLRRWHKHDEIRQDFTKWDALDLSFGSLQPSPKEQGLSNWLALPKCGRKLIAVFELWPVTQLSLPILSIKRLSNDPSLKDWTAFILQSSVHFGWKAKDLDCTFWYQFCGMAKAMSHSKWQMNGRFFPLQSFHGTYHYLSCKHHQEVHLLMVFEGLINLQSVNPIRELCCTLLSRAPERSDDAMEKIRHQLEYLRHASLL